MRGLYQGKFLHEMTNDEIKEIKAKLDLKEINRLLDEEQWDAVRSIFKVPPVNYAWEQSQAKKNPFKKDAI